jgi:hypothetical protein
LRLLFNRFDNRRMTVTETIDRNAGEKVEIFLAVGVPHLDSAPFNQCQRRARVGFGNELISQRRHVFVLHLLSHHLGANALLGEDFQKHRVLHPAVNDVGFFDAAFERINATLDFRNHSRADDAVLNHLTRLLFGERAHQRALLIFHPVDVGHEQKFFCVQGLGDLSGD